MPTTMMSTSTDTLFQPIDDAIIRALSAFQSAHYLEIACLTLLVYDLLITFGEEVCRGS
jgi:hypothetical protein